VSGDLEGTFVVVVAEGAGATKAVGLADELRARGGRVAVFAPEGDPVDTDAVLELVAELRKTR
jgi:transketolase C-terminal domain/subunit